METCKVAKERVCIVAPTYFSVGGMGIMVRQLINILGESYEVMVLSIKGIEDEKRDFFHYDIALNSKLKIFINPWHVPSLLLYEVLGVMWCFALMLAGVRRFLVQEAITGAFFATLIGEILGAHVFLFDYGPMLNLYDRGFSRVKSTRSWKFRRGRLQLVYTSMLKVANRFALRHCRKFFVYNQEMKDCVLANGLKNEKIIFYNFPMDTSIFREYSSAMRKKIRNRLAIKKSDIVITFIGRISHDKGLLHLLEAIRHLIGEHRKSVRFLIAGDGPLLNWVLENTASYGERVSLLGPLYKSKEIVNALNASDIFVYPITMSYGYALSVLEAMATGLPTIITEIGPTKELIVNGHNGITVPVRDSAALIRALNHLIDDEDLRKRMGENAKKVLSRFSVESYRHTILNNIA